MAETPFDPNKQAEAFRTPQQVINNLTGETAPDFQINPSSIDKKIVATASFPELLYKLSSTGKILSVKVTNQVEKDKALAQGWHRGHPVQETEFVEAEAEGLQPLSVLEDTAEDTDEDHDGGADDHDAPKKRGRKPKG